MRITFLLAHADLSGGVRMIANYARQMARRGHEVVVVSRPPRRPTMRERIRAALGGPRPPAITRRGPSHLDGIDVRHHVIDSHRPIVASDLPDADVMVATWWETAQWSSGFPASKGAPVFFAQGYETREGLPAEVLDSVWRLPMHKIVIARWLARLCEERFGDFDYSLVPNAVDLDQFSVPPRGKQPQPTVGLVYTHVHSKGIDLALEAFDLAKAKRPDLKLVTFGAREPTAELPLPDKAAFILRPAQDRIKDIYASADAWLFSSRQEGFGLPLLEAMASRTPVVATPAGAAQEVLEDGGGILVPPEDPQAMAEALLSVVNMNEPVWRTLSDKAHSVACRYSWEQSAELFEAALERAIEKQRGFSHTSPSPDRL